MTNEMTDKPEFLVENDLDRVAAGAIELNVEKIERCFFRPNPAGDGTTEHFLIGLEDAEDSL